MKFWKSLDNNIKAHFVKSALEENSRIKKNTIKVVDSCTEKKYAAKDSDEVKELLESFKDVVASDLQLNDTTADSENYRLKKLVCTCQMLANLADDTAATLSCVINVLTTRE